MKRHEPTSSSTETILSALREPDRFLEETVSTARANLDRCVRDAATYAQRRPEKALLTALGAGYVLRILPLAGILRMFIRLALALIKPAGLIYGGAKLWQKMQNSVPSHATRERS